MWVPYFMYLWPWPTPKHQPSVSQRFSTRTRLSVKTRNFHNINIKNHEELSQQLWHKCDKPATGSKSKYYRWILVWRCVKSWTLVTCKVWSWTHMAECICCVSRVHAMSHLFPSRIALIFFFPSSRTDDGRNRKLYIVFSNIPKIVSGVKGRALWWPNHLWKLCLMPDESLHCHLEISLIIREEN